MSRWWIVRFARFYASQRPAYAASALAFQGLLSVFPLLALFLTLFGAAGPALLGKRWVVDLLGAVFPALTARELGRIVGSLRPSSGPLGAFAGIGLAWTGSLLLDTLEAALDDMYGAPPRPPWSQKLLALALMALFGVCLTLVMGAAILGGHVHRVVPPPWNRVADAAVRALGLGAGWLLFAVVLAVVPNLPLRLRDVWVGASVGAVSLTAVTQAVGPYLRLLRLWRYGHLAVWLGLALWLQFLAEVLLGSAALNRFLQLSRDPGEGDQR